jgi:hypothetical protein
MVFGGSPDTHSILRAQNWTYYPDVPVYDGNRRYEPHAGESMARRIAKRILRSGWFRTDVGKRVAALKIPPIEIREQREYRDQLVTLASPFLLRLAPDLEYLRWRYSLDLPFARYRLFEIAAADEVIGYVILHERANQVVVSHADGSDARLLAAGIMKAVAFVIEGDLKPRRVLLTSTHPEMQAVFEASGMRAAGQGRPFALKGQRRYGFVSAGHHELVDQLRLGRQLPETTVRTGVSPEAGACSVESRSRGAESPARSSERPHMSHSEINRRIVLASRPKGTPVSGDFLFEEAPVPAPGKGGVLLRTLYLSLDPYMRGMMNERAPAYTRSVAIGEVMPGGTVNRVVTSDNPRFKVGDLVLGRRRLAGIRRQ